MSKAVTKISIVFALIIGLTPLFNDQATAITSPFIIPTEGEVKATYQDPEYLQEFGKEHYGIDIANNGIVPVVATADGEVVFADFHNGSTPENSYGNLIRINHDIDDVFYQSCYAHLNTFLVKEGDYVHQGEIIGYMGNTGFSKGQHLHFEIHEGGEWNASKSFAIDPMKLLNGLSTVAENYHVFDGTWASLSINNKTDDLYKVDIFEGPGTGLKGTVSSDSTYNVYGKLYDTEGEFGYFDIGDSSFILEDNVTITPYQATINSESPVQIFSTPGGTAVSQVEPGATFEATGAKEIDGVEWYALSNIGWIMAEYVNVTK